MCSLGALFFLVRLGGDKMGPLQIAKCIAKLMCDDMRIECLLHYVQVGSPKTKLFFFLGLISWSSSNTMKGNFVSGQRGTKES